MRKYDKIVSAYRACKTIDDLKNAAKKTGPDVLDLLACDKSVGRAALEAYIFYHKRLTGEQHGNGMFMGKPKKVFIDNIMAKVKAPK